MFDVEAAFLNSDLDNKMYIEWPEGMLELGLITEEERKNCCIELQKAMYGNIDSPLRWMLTFSKFLKEELGLLQSKSDPCVFYKLDNDGTPILILVIYVDDTMICGAESEVKRAYEEIEKRFNIEKLGKLFKHLGIWWEWRVGKDGEVYLVATMPQMVKEIAEAYRNVTKKEAKSSETPGFPGKSLSKHEGEAKHHDEYRSIVGKLMYMMTKNAPDISNAVRELATHLQCPGE
jgi:hypothetical protein